MNQNKLLTPYYFLRNNQLNRLKNKQVHIYFDQPLKRPILVMNTGFLKLAFFQKGQVTPSTFFIKPKNVYLLKSFVNKWRILHYYPIDYHNHWVKKLSIENKQRLQYYYKKDYYLLNNLSTNFKEHSFDIYTSLQNFFQEQRWRIKTKQTFELNNFHKFNSTLFRYRFRKRKWWRPTYFTHRGFVFNYPLKLIRKQSSLILFRGHWLRRFKNLYRITFLMFKYLTLGNHFQLTPSQLYVYYHFFYYKRQSILQRLWRLRKIKRKSKFGKFYRKHVLQINSMGTFLNANWKAPTPELDYFLPNNAKYNNILVDYYRMQLRKDAAQIYEYLNLLSFNVINLNCNFGNQFKESSHFSSLFGLNIFKCFDTSIDVQLRILSNVIFSCLYWCNCCFIFIYSNDVKY